MKKATQSRSLKTALLGVVAALASDGLLDADTAAVINRYLVFLYPVVIVVLRQITSTPLRWKS